MQKLHLQPLAGALGQEVRRGAGRVPRGAHDIRPVEQQLHRAQHIGQHHGGTQRLDAHENRHGGGLLPSSSHLLPERRPV